MASESALRPSRELKLAVVVLSTAACALSAVYFGYLEGIDTVYTHFFYVPIILGGFWFDRRAVYIGVFLGLVYLASLQLSTATVQSDDVLRVGMMVTVAFVLGSLSERRSRAERELADHKAHLEQTVSARTAELSEANEKLRLLGKITRHDLLNQLSVLVGWLELAHESRHDGEAFKELDRAFESAEAIRDDLQFTADYERLGVAKPVWVGAGHAFLMGVSRFDLSQVGVKNDLGTLEILADRMIEKVFSNLVDNSLRHGRGVTMVAVRWEEVPDGLVVVYEDDGSGISPDRRAGLFESGSGDHTGMGLFMARKILGITGLTIDEKGTPGKGVRFEIHVPKGRFRFVSEG